MGTNNTVTELVAIYGCNKSLIPKITSRVKKYF